MRRPKSTPREILKEVARVTVDASESIYFALEHRDLKQRDLAGALGLSDGRVSRLLNEKRDMHLSTYVKALGALNCRLTLKVTDEEGAVVFESRPRTPRVSEWRQVPSAPIAPHTSARILEGPWRRAMMLSPARAATGAGQGSDRNSAEAS